ncbi:hypothetical protein [Clostridium sp.]|uniref:hypothetical protein n=1 Tax=Clostridium sp. TaxID=1506 RepID=UPI002FCAD6D7
MQKDNFIEMVDTLINILEDKSVLTNGYSEGLEYFTSFKEEKDKDKAKPLFTDNGKLIISTMQENTKEDVCQFKASQIAEFAFVSSRTISGAIRKLVTDGYVEKIEGTNPIAYCLTDAGKNIVFDK